MEKNSMKHLIIAIGGVGFLIAGPQIYNWVLVVGDGMIQEPFHVIGILLSLVGICCCVGAMLCQLDRYKK